ncbi:hypothetical protein Tco_0157823 [Tanacetum coccineum]
MRKQQVLDLVLGGNQRVEFSRLFVLDGFQQERHSPLAQQRLKLNPQMVQMKISLTNVKANNSYWSVHGTPLKYRYIVQSYRGRTQSLVAEKTDISENRASRNFDLMIIKWRLLKITLQAPFLNVHKTFDVHDRSGLPMS